MGHLIPAGSGFVAYNSVKLKPLVKPMKEVVVEEEEPEATRIAFRSSRKYLEHTKCSKKRL